MDPQTTEQTPEEVKVEQTIPTDSETTENIEKEAENDEKEVSEEVEESEKIETPEEENVEAEDETTSQNSADDVNKDFEKAQELKIEANDLYRAGNIDEVSTFFH